LNPNRDLASSIAEASDVLRAAKLPVDTPHLVAGLSFGFWTRLFARRRERTLWTPGLHLVFKRSRNVIGSSITRTQASSRLDHLRTFRNRIAHHEPIYHRALLSDFDSVTTLTECMYEDVGAWMRALSDCQALLRAGSPLHRTSVVIEGWCGHFH
jgi:hypothetical protein